MAAEGKPAGHSSGFDWLGFVSCLCPGRGGFVVLFDFVLGDVLGRLGRGGRFNFDHDGRQAPLAFDGLKAHVEQQALRLGVEKSRHPEETVILYGGRPYQLGIEEKDRRQVEIPVAQVGKDFGEARIRVGRLKLWRTQIMQHGIIACLVRLTECDQRRSNKHVDLELIWNRRSASVRRPIAGRRLRHCLAVSSSNYQNRYKREDNRPARAARATLRMLKHAHHRQTLCHKPEVRQSRRSERREMG